MKEIKAKMSFHYNGTFYDKNDIVKVASIQDLIRLNEQGFIEPLSPKDLQNFENKKTEIKVKEKED